MTSETQQRFEILLAEVRSVQGQLRDCQTFKFYVVTMTRRHQQGELSDPTYIRRMHDLVAHELLDEPEGA
jgi:hypothetical protein